MTYETDIARIRSRIAGWENHLGLIKRGVRHRRAGVDVTERTAKTLKRWIADEARLLASLEAAAT